MKSFSSWSPLLLLPLALQPLGVLADPDLKAVCDKVKASLTSTVSALSVPGAGTYDAQIHTFMSNNQQNATCAVSPSTPDEVSAIIKIIGSERAPFAIKSGGHMHNPGFSSTPGVMISMDKFTTVNYDSSAKTVEIGSGLLWQDVAAKLDPLGVGVLGGRCGSVGVGGYALGGGYSWLSNQYGLFVDTVVAYNMVLPDGSIKQVTSSSDADLFMALKGSLNNYGVLTSVVAKTFPLGQIWGGDIAYAPEQADKVIAAGVDFMDKSVDTKSQFYTTHAYAGGNQITSASMFYDGPSYNTSADKALYDAFVNIPSVSNAAAPKTMQAMVTGVGLFLQAPGARWAADSASFTKYSTAFLNEVVKQTKFWGQDCAAHGCMIHAVLVEPFNANLYKQATPSAFPHGSDHPIFLTNILFTWTDPKEDAYFNAAIKSIKNALTATAIADGQDVQGAKEIHYPNYTYMDQTVDHIYGDGLDKLKSVKGRVDPNDVMGLTGSFKIQAAAGSGGSGKGSAAPVGFAVSTWAAFGAVVMVVLSAF